MSSKFLNANTDVTLSENSDRQIPSQKAVKTYVDNKTSVLATKGELTTGLSEKQDVISDLDTIRQGAALGATALQAVPDEYVTETELAALNFVKWVDTLPETGESKYIYAVPREETDTDGKQIAALYLWDGSAWRGAGAFSLNIDPATLATKEELAGYLPLSGGTLSGNLRGVRFYSDRYSFDNGSNVAVKESQFLMLGDNSNILVLNTKDERIRFRKQSTGNAQHYILSELDKAVANGVASLDANAKVPVAQIPDLSSTYATINSLATVATSGSYNDLTNKPTIPTVGNAKIEIQKNGTKVDSFTANQATAKTINITVPTTAADVSALPASTKYGYAFDLSIDPDTYVVSLTMKDQDGTAIGASQTIDLPLESVVVSGSYDNTNKKIVLTLQSGSTVDVPVGDLIAGLQTEITSTNKLSADLIKDGTTNKVVTATEKNTWNGKQAAISDLATIRSGAGKGATAVQPGDLAKVATSGMYSDLTGTPGVATADTLGLVKPDGTTITVTKNGIISAAGGSGFDFEGTKAEFNAAVAAGTITADSVSLITDDVSGDTVATKAELQAVDRSKADTALSNVSANIDYVVESKFPTADDPTWYRVYKSGWVEQGGVIPAVVGNITFLKPFANTNYTVVGNVCLTYRRVGQGDGSGSVLFFPEATSFCYVTLAARNFGDIGNQNISWEAKGQGAA